MGALKRHFFLSSCILILSVSLTNSQPDFRLFNCGNNETSTGFVSNRDALLPLLSSNLDSYGFYNSSLGQNPDRINALVLCRGDVDLNTCRSCLNNSIHKIVQVCPNHWQAFGLYDECLLRFSNDSVIGNLQTYPYVQIYNTADVPDPVRFNESLRNLVSRLRDQAANGGRLKFATGNTSGPGFTNIYTLSQCTPDLSREQCINCLDLAASRIGECCNAKRGAMILTASCALRFEEYLFYNDIRASNDTPAGVPQPSPQGHENGTSTRTVIIIVILTVISVILAFSTWIFLRKRKHRKPKQTIETKDEMSSVESIRYNFETLRIATDDFSSDNKLGQGGFGAVYKGKLLNGQDIAVKRLSRNSQQGDLEFKNEVLLVMKLQHRNLVRLLGFCLEGTEMLLIYEFVANASLDHFIFDPLKQTYLDWFRRYNIIGGIARGLLYLHEDSRLRIIHRDLKASNVLLDAEMNPKISDFGLARLFVLDETQGNTSRIAGTYGYMAPEYAMRGQFSTKSDVFSFGVLILEIISGRKNNIFRRGENVEDLLSSAWKNWLGGTASNIIDPTLRNNSSSINDIMRCIHIGLLCVQEKVEDRPTMASVALLLTSSSLTLARPSEPAFLIYSSVDPEKPLLRESGNSENKSGTWSVNEASTTELYPR